MDPLSNSQTTPQARDRESVINASTATSIRSRASSVFSTGTKFSIATLPQQDTGPLPGSSQMGGDGDGGAFAAASGPSSFDPSSMSTLSRPPVSRPFFSSRPMSIYSFRSTGGESLPAYEEAHPGYSASVSPPTTPSITTFVPVDATTTPSATATNSAPPTSSQPPSAFLPPFPKGGGDDDDDDDDEPFSNIPSITLTQPPPTRDPDALISHYTTVLTHVLRTHSPNPPNPKTLEDDAAEPSSSSSAADHPSSLSTPLLSQLRNTIDAAYRHELRQRTHDLDRTRAALLARETELEASLASHRAAFEAHVSALQAAQDRAVERARWAVEEIWEARWTARVALEAERDEEWRERVRELRERLQEREEWWVGRWEEREREWTGRGDGDGDGDEGGSAKVG